MDNKFIYIIFIFLLLISGCSSDLGRYVSKPFMVSTNPPEGPANYQQGWKDGCETGISSTNSFFYQSLGSYQFKLDENLRRDVLYSQAWKYGFNHCGYSMRAIKRYDL